MQKIILAAILFILLLVLSCTNTEEPLESRIISLNPDKVEAVKVGSFINKVEYLKLSSENDAQFGSISAMQVSGERIYILDSFQSIGLYVYDRDGNILFYIDSYGRGPGEFLGPYDFAIDKEENHIIIYDGAGRKLCYYRWQDGTFIKEKPLEYAIGNFAVTRSNYIFFLNNFAYTGFDHNIIITDKNLEIIDRRLEINLNMANYHFELPVNFSVYENHLFFTAPEDYNIYRTETDNNTFGKYLTVNFGDRALPESFYKKHADNQSRFTEIGESAHNISGYFESDSFRYFNYDIGPGDAQHYYLESKKSGRIIHTSYDQLVDDIKIGPLPRWPLAIVGDKLVWPQQPAVLLRYLEEKKAALDEEKWQTFRNENKKLVSFAQTLTAENNPYLIFSKIDF